MKVWVIRFNNTDFAPFEGVYTDFASAYNDMISKLKDMNCKKIHSLDTCLMTDNGIPYWTWYSFRFHKEKEKVCIYQTTIKN